MILSRVTGGVTAAVALSPCTISILRECPVDVISPTGHNHEGKSCDFTLVNLYRPRVPTHIELARNFTPPCAILFHHCISSRCFRVFIRCSLISSFFPEKIFFYLNQIRIKNVPYIWIKIYIIFLSAVMLKESNSKLSKAEAPRLKHQIM